MKRELIRIPTAVSLREVDLLNTLALDKNVLEIGSLLGYSTINIARNANKVTSIDPHEGYPYDGADSTINKFKDNLYRYNIYNVRIFKDFFENIKIEKYDFAFIDLDGTYETTLKTLEYIKNIPLIVIHDFKRQRCSGVEEAIKEKKLHIIQVIDTCVIINN